MPGEQRGVQPGFILRAPPSISGEVSAKAHVLQHKTPAAVSPAAGPGHTCPTESLRGGPDVSHPGGVASLWVGSQRRRTSHCYLV